MINLRSITNVYNQINNVVDTNVLVAGGCIRDYLCNQPSYKDIDVFIQCEGRQDFFSKLDKLKPVFGLPHNPDSLEQEYNSTDCAPPILGVADFKCRIDTCLQIVGFKISKNIEFSSAVFNSFDFSVNCCGLDTTGIIDTPEAKTDRRCNTFTLKNVWSGKQLLKVIDKYKRLSSTKYKNWEFNYKQDAFH